MLGTTKTRTTPYHPKSDGMVERFNQTLETMLSAYVSDNHRDWDRQLPWVTTSSTIILATVPASMFAIAKASVHFVK
jgi:hypothetical protein